MVSSLRSGARRRHHAHRLFFRIVRLASMAAVPVGLAGWLCIGNAVADELSARDFLRDPEFANVQLSPDGGKISALTKLGKPGYNLVVMDLASGDVHQVTSLEESEVWWYRWLDDEHLIFFYNEPNPRVAGFYVTGLDGRPAKRQRDPWFWRAVASNNYSHGYIGPIGSSEAQIARCHGRDGSIARPGGLPSLPRTAAVVRLLLDHDCRLRGVIEAREAGNGRLFRIHFRSSAKDKWRVIGEYRDLEGHVFPLAFDYDNRHLFALSDTGRDTAALYRLDPETGELGEPIYANDRFDVSDVVLSDAERRLVGVRYLADEPQTVWLEEKRVRLSSGIADALPEYTIHIEFSDDGHIALVDASGAQSPGGYWLYDAQAGTLKELLPQAEWLRPEEMALVTPVEFEARDGLPVFGYLTRPSKFQGAAPPVIVNPHGGPYGIRTAATFNGRNQFFASRGYAVLQVDFRGSGGYGSSFERAGRREYGEAMVDDVVDGVRWAAAEGLVDLERVCVYGGSYGGYSAMMAAVEYPELFRCAISFAGVSDLREQWRGAARASSGEAKWFGRQIGDYWDDKERLRRISPVHRASEFEVPLLLMHGKLDRVVHWHQTHAMEQAMKAHNKAVEVILFDDEGHGFHWEDNRVEAHEAMLAFVREHLETSTETELATR